jgi:glucoamylase
MLPTFLPEEYLQPWLYESRNASHNETQPERPLLEATIRAYIQAQSEIQVKPNPSGDLWTGGLNEPKSHVDGSRFDGEWGRPQMYVAPTGRD